MSIISRVKGTQDFLELTVYNFIIDQFKTHVRSYHFTEIATPILEPVELFKRSLGPYTDVVTKEMFIINGGEHEEDGICLRPEATAPTMRAFIENSIQTVPWKVFSYGPMFRHERPQKGRYRQFHQINVEVIGSSAIAQDVQLITMLDRFFHEKLQLNNYALLLNFLGCPDDRLQYRDKLLIFLNSDAAADICETCKVRKEKNIMRIFDCKNPACQEMYRNAPRIADSLCEACEKEWAQVQEQLALLSVSHAYAPNLVRGLDYYNKTVFEFVSENLGAQNSFCGGGRYDQLASLLGAKEDQPSIGAAMGIERIMLLLEPTLDTLPLPQPPALQVIMPLSAAQQPLALLLADTLQAQNFCVEVLLEGDSMKSMMRKANKLGAAYALILGDEEQQNKTVMVKNMTTGEQEHVAQADVVGYLSK